MNEQFKKLEELLSTFNESNPQASEAIMQETMSIFGEVMKKLASPNENERKEALKTATDLRNVLEGHARKRLKSMGMDDEKIESMLKNNPMMDRMSMFPNPSIKPEGVSKPETEQKILDLSKKSQWIQG
jgi:hypothetical protein